ncbi:hypothetical protein TRP8649_04746 [Pelagimonas phthalicica]|uniref:Uncharacterized protein n=1 Tax=Pelagimonas phthalicica TaxID=1037362 RepID=A0A238JL02_9RHOB|nr:hypothetical protein CLV87_4835 [Pelagimonas phthalicica]SMX30602.1 hypothetical protein TRP8649_04746 [Pelagimonas phthalicica]
MAAQLAKLPQDQFLTLCSTLTTDIEADRIQAHKAALKAESCRLKAEAERATWAEAQELLETTIPIALDLFERDQAAFRKAKVEIERSAEGFLANSREQSRQIRAQLVRYGRQIAPEYCRQEVGDWVKELQIVGISASAEAYKAYYNNFVRVISKAELAAA